MKQVFINLLGELEALMHMKGQPFRGRAYHKAAESLMNYQKKITKSEELKELPNIGPSILKKFKEYEETGKLRILEEAKKNPIYMFTTIFGIGPKKAKKLVETEKITTIEQLRERQEDVLNNVQKKGLKYFEDVQLRIPRNEINKFKIRLGEIFNNLKNIDGSSFEIVGSYRRGNTDSGDIDIIITNNKNNKKVFAEFLTNLVKAGLLVDIFSKGKTKSLAIGKIENCPCRRLDFLYTPPEEYPFAILYFTGSKAFNIVMRAHSLKLGYSMNEHGFYKMNGKKKGEKIDKIFTTEKSIFEFLKIVYKTPTERINGQAVIPLTIVNNVKDVIIFLSKKYGFDTKEATSSIKKNNMNNMVKFQKPFLKWLGGKTQIINKIMKHFPKEMNNYHELFLGGGSVLFAVLSSEIKIKNKIYAYDINEGLIDLYKNIKTKKDELFQYITKYLTEYHNLKGTVINRNPLSLDDAKTSKESYYYWVRNQCFNKMDKKTVEYSAIFLFLNKTCFRGMYREGPNGFNVPYGHHKKTPKIITKEELNKISELIKNVEFVCSDFNISMKNIKHGDYVYLDPPYAPKKKGSFVNYTQKGFGLKDHKKLFEGVSNLNNKGIKFSMSNAKVDLVINHFKNFNQEEINARRAINSKNPGAKTMELIISN